jgi:hypothetical protein
MQSSAETRRARHERWLIALAILALYGAAIWYIAQGDRPVSIDPRAYRCDAEQALACVGMRL